MITPVLLCGGAGTRLWPLSRKSFPKQFTDIVGKESLFQASARRFTGAGFAAPVVVTGNEFRFIVTEPVPYTPLDVYKRQGVGGIVLAIARNRRSACVNRGSPGFAVSRRTSISISAAACWLRRFARRPT